MIIIVYKTLLELIQYRAAPNAKVVKTVNPIKRSKNTAEIALLLLPDDLDTS